ncbi:MAG: ABC transporter ATP-binding protein [Paracoccus sp. (in: a-proteobacteria)]|uniref:ABC transporter ATP-binding protein n=1 Tax=Paracoccus sp. TaxID=267 RepID=UPI0039E28E66
MSLPAPLVDVEGLSHAWEGRRVLDQASLQLAPGRITVILGPSGCGKTTLLRLVAGLLAPRAGRIRVAGQPPRPGRSTALLFQEPRLLPWRRVSDNLGLVLPHLSALARAERIAALLARVGLADRAQDWPEELSGGQQQRLALARILATGAPLLLMDEPFASLDALARAEMQDEVLRLLADEPARAVLFVTHSIDEALVLADEILLMRGGPGSFAEVDPGSLGSRGHKRRLHPGFSRMVAEIEAHLRGVSLALSG